LIAGVSQAARLSLQQKLQQLRALRRCAISFKNSTVQAQLGDVYNNIFSEAFHWHVPPAKLVRRNLRVSAIKLLLGLSTWNQINELASQ
jgi:hypothetical protein